MTDSRTFAAITVTIGILALGHALYTWPLDATLALFLGGAAIAFIGEAFAIALDWLEHHIGPKVLGVPLYLLFGWTGVVYIAFRIALLSTSGWVAVLLATGLATAYDIFSDNRGVADGHWTYTDSLPGPRHGEVPWWNYVGWFLISSITAGLALQFL